MDSNQPQNDYQINELENQSPQYEDDQAYLQIYYKLIQNKQLLSLQNFRQRVPKDVFQSAISYPQFFKSNLVANGRVIKILKGPNAIIKAFYYQLFKLTFQLEVPDKDYVDLLKNILFHPDLIQIDSNFSHTSPTSGKKHSDIQYKKFLAEFIQMLSNQSPPNFQMSLNQYPVINEALQVTFQFLLRVNTNGNQQNQNQTLNNQQKLLKLCDIFDIHVQIIQKCYKFEESDVFLYEQNENQYYMAFLNEMEQVEESSNQGHSTSSKSDKKQEHERYHDQFEPIQGQKVINKPVVTQTTQIQPQKMEQYQSKHSYSNSHPNNFSFPQKQLAKNTEYYGSRKTSKNEDESLFKGGKQQTIMNMLGDFSKSGDGSSSPFYKNVSTSKTSQFKIQQKNDLFLQRQASQVQKYDVLNTNGSNQSSKINNENKYQNQQTARTQQPLPFHKKNHIQQVNVNIRDHYEISPRNNWNLNNNNNQNVNIRQNFNNQGYMNAYQNNFQLNHQQNNNQISNKNSREVINHQSQFYQSHTHNQKVYSKPVYIDQNPSQTSYASSHINYFSSTNHHQQTHNPNINMQTFPPPKHSQFQQPLIYKPKGYQPNLQTIFQMSQSKQGNTANSKADQGQNPFGLDINFNKNRTTHHKQSKQLGNDDTKGTFYRQFTNTKILKLVKQPYKTKVQMIKNGWIGVRSRNYVGPQNKQQYQQHS